MAVISLPSTPKPRSASLTLFREDTALRLMNGGEVIVVDQTALWRYSFNLPPMEEANGQIWASRLSQLSSLENTFKATPPNYDGPATGYSGSAPVVKGGSQTGKSLLCDGVSLSTDVLKEGDYFQVGSELKIATADASSDGNGDITINFEPKLRTSPADNATLDIQTPQATFRLMEPTADWALRLPMLFEIKVEAIETWTP